MNAVLVEKGSASNLADIFKKQQMPGEFSAKTVGKMTFHNRVSSGNKMVSSNIASANSSMVA